MESALKPSIKPATPLPWTVGDDRKMRQQQAAQGALPIFAYSKAHDCNLSAMDLRGIEAADVRSNAAYIVHAANAYPRLVEALRSVLPSLWNDNAVAKVYEKERDAAKALLRELGEDA